METEITNISPNGVWILTEGKELFMSFEIFPWFKDASVAKIVNVETYGNGHLYWPDLDIDLTVDIIEHPENFPLIAS
ncbi:MAG: DUF2442 domain-containing protein [Sulfuricurvum sp.]